MDWSFPKSGRISLLSGIARARASLLNIVRKSGMVGRYEILVLLHPWCVCHWLSETSFWFGLRHIMATLLYVFFPSKPIPAPASQLTMSNRPKFPVMKNKYEFCLWFEWLQTYSLIAPCAVFFCTMLLNAVIFSLYDPQNRQTLRKP